MTGTLRYSLRVLHAVSKANERELLNIQARSPQTANIYRRLGLRGRLHSSTVPPFRKHRTSLQASPRNVVHRSGACSHSRSKLVSSRPSGSWTVLTDRKSALEALSAPRSQVVSDIRSLILIVHNILVTSGHCVWYRWVPSHIGLPGNTRADTAARRAHSAAECNTVITLSPSVCRIHIRRRLSFDTRLFMESTVAANTFLHRIDPKMAFSVSLRLSRKEESALHRLRLNVARTPSFLFKIKQRPSSACPSCSTDADTHHLLLTCPRYAASRTALTHRLSALGHRDLSLATLLGPVGQKQRAVTRALICFLGDSGLLECL
ncbi:uncharacterized protein LOC135392542 [Ornithodoros turicata]|uniref:uncharacterized protein LOC135392542 n=1 Tax=Ornithodoros turicata TaxID=34597 RepID=UPI0031394433